MPSVIIAPDYRDCMIGSLQVPGPAAWFAEQYRLDEGELVRLVPPPFPPERTSQLRTGWIASSAKQHGQMTFYDRPQGTHLWQVSSGLGTAGSAVIDCGIVTQGQINIPADLRLLSVDGDWIVRENASPDERLQALAPILSSFLKRDIRIEKKNVSLEVIVTRGTWKYHAIPGASNPGSIHLFAADQIDTRIGGGGGTGSLDHFLQGIENVTRRQIINHIEGAPRSISWRDHYSYYSIGTDFQKLSLFLNNLSRQTSINFSIEKQQAYQFELSEARP